MVVVNVVENRFWKSSAGRAVSIFGALPYMTEAEKIAHGWKIVTDGWTTQNADGTYGSSVRHATKDSAVAFALDCNTRRIGQLKDHATYYPETAAACAERIGVIESYVRAICADAGIPAGWAIA